MIVPDINLLVYAYNSDAPFHDDARVWWEDLLSGSGSVGLAWVVSLGFVRIMTSRAVLTDPLMPGEAISYVRSWLRRPQTHVLQPGPRHLEILAAIMRDSRVTGRMTTDAHLAALAIETQSELHSNDTDFSRFQGLRWRNPLSGGENR
ncbi:MAG: type II toxin-antitoxin system VapC family toxin [Thermoanaerobaculales bacterium]|nr:type II toxin-antitoxin system VapC family toxin [Thermoanaerobaculales bacterium]